MLAADTRNEEAAMRLLFTAPLHTPTQARAHTTGFSLPSGKVQSSGAYPQGQQGVSRVTL